uniref:Uncharacterized protein n=1 Tax=Setaria viridis TaxID=4556 RepID=A0A4U6TDZ9_SETVI|nr:hypothetical protein SEVIR_8G010850v2 [Setaria viridis]
MGGGIKLGALKVQLYLRFLLLLFFPPDQRSGLSHPAVTLLHRRHSRGRGCRCAL